MITNEDGCSISSDDVFVNCEALGIDDIVSADISVYPNPGNGEFNLEIGGYSGELSLQIFDIMGREVNKQNIFISPQNNTVSIQLPVPSGMYFLQVKNEDVDEGAVLMIE